MRLFPQRSARRRVVALLAEVRPESASRAAAGGARLGQDLGMDSLATAALAVRLAEEFEIDLVALAGRRAEIETIDDLVAVVEELADAG
ncbi:hypothetical protein AGRA3207_002279 [Actinomadura graeca]|uniref:Carrier domain-containing protein n=1 Tax=Actinomadura graeca TaxID=2750812 RepID=A0ABX8QUL5_9ACTN|nr:phosphopantetheine-binding protein [Actinomadura graeca]QXJ21427.1 hypothetical protein AGRA3207_002279 [Actinomadura graeca]